MENRNPLLPSRILVVGKSGSGKTTLVRRKLIPQLRNDHPGIFIFVMEPLPNARGIWSYDCRERFFSAFELLDFFSKEVSPGVYCISIPLDDTLGIDVFFHFLDLFCRRQKCALVVDELLAYSSARSTQKSFRYFLNYGRRYGLELIYCSMRPVDVDGMLLTNVTRIICFQDHYQRNLEGLKRVAFVGDRADETARLPRFEYLEFSDEFD